MERPSPARAVTPGKGVRVFWFACRSEQPRPDAIGAVACFDGVYFGVVLCAVAARARQRTPALQHTGPATTGHSSPYCVRVFL